MLILFLAGLGYLLTRGSNPSNLLREASHTGPAEQAKEALLGYAAAQYGDGRLPLPDMGLLPPNTAHTEGSIATNFAGNSDEAVLFGRLPWFSLGIEPPRDHTGECLWYAVGGRWKKNNVDTHWLNWDSLGEFELLTQSTSGAAPVFDSPHVNKPAAIVFAPGAPLPIQDRSQTTISGESTERCGGNYKAHQYLDPPPTWNPAAGNAPLAGTGSVEHSNISNRSLTVLVTPLFEPHQRKTALLSPTESGSSNDLALPITVDDIFDRVTQLPGFAPQINQSLLTAVAQCLETQSLPVLAGQAPLAGGTTLTGGKLPIDFADTCANIPASNKNFVKRWANNLWYLRCNSGQCINTNSCGGALLFGGRRLSTQRRSNDGERTDPKQYFEGSTLKLFSPPGTTDIPLQSDFLAADQHTDSARCLNVNSAGHKVPVTALTPAGPTFGTPSNPRPLVRLDTNTDEIILGEDIKKLGKDPAQCQPTGCTWLTEPLATKHGLRVFFRFSIVQKGDGFVFAITDAAHNNANVCGAADTNGKFLGYAGRNICGNAALATPPISHPKIGIEFDTEQNNSSGNKPSCNDRNDNDGQHVALVYWGYSHSAPDSYVGKNADKTTKKPFYEDSDCGQSSPDADYFEDDNFHYPKAAARPPAASGYQDPPQTLREEIKNLKDKGRSFFVRMDITRTSASDSTTRIETQLWVSETQISGMSNLNQDFITINAAAPATITDNVLVEHRPEGSPSPDGDLGAFARIRFGFTNALSAKSNGSKQEIRIADLAVAARPAP